MSDLCEFKAGDKVVVTYSESSYPSVGDILDVVDFVDGYEWITPTEVEAGCMDGAFGFRFEKLAPPVVPTEVAVPVTGNPKYNREIKPDVFVDVYDVLYAFKVTDPCLQHLIKKALAAGQRGHKDARQDLVDIRDSAQRALDSYDLWEKPNA